MPRTLAQRLATGPLHPADGLLAKPPRFAFAVDPDSPPKAALALATGSHPLATFSLAPCSPPNAARAPACGSPPNAALALATGSRPRAALAAPLLLTAALLWPTAGAAADAAPAPIPLGVPQGYAALVRRVAPSVVTVMVEEQTISAGQRAADRANPNTEYDAVGELIRRLLSGAGGNSSADERASAALGSGFLIRADGLIITNRHVIVGARLVRVRLMDGREFPAKILGADAVTDIALLKVDAGKLPVLHLGSSDSVSVGDAVIAIGNPFGLGQSVSAGIVSARERTLEDDPYIDFLQTDAAINRGNSGGPLLAPDGTVVGVTSAIFSPSGGSVGLGFAIPAETAAAVIGQLEAHGRVERGYLGISAQAPTPAMAKALGMKKATGALVTEVDPQGPSAGALAVGDVLLHVASHPVTFKTLSITTARLKPNTLVVTTVFRGGHEESVALTIGSLPEPKPDPAMTGDQDTWVPALHLGVANTTEAIRKAIKASDEPSGVIVTQLRPAGAGSLAGLKVGDLITHQGTKSVITVSDIAKIAQPSPDAPLLIRVVREGVPGFIAVTGEPESPFP